MKRLSPDSPELKSADLVAENIERLRELFPEAFANEGKIDFDVLRQLLGDRVDDAEERYGLNWHGKRAARQLALTPSTGTLRPCPEESVDWDTTQNIFIEGDNLEVLKLLQKSYAGKVKLIYIDPPYNTGKDFVYPDNFQDSIRNYLEITGQADGGHSITSNTDANGRFHTDWLNMLYPRLKLARTLLSPDGLIAISIGDREVASLRRMCDEVFFEEGYKGTIVRTTGQTTGQDSGGLGASFDYVVLYAQNPDVELCGLPLEDHDLERYEEQDDKGRYALWQLRKTGSNDRRADRPSMYFAVKDPDGKDVYPVGPTGYESRWRFDPKGYARLLAENYIVWKKRPKGDGEHWWPYVKTYLEGRTKRPSPLWDDLDGSKKASIDLRALMGGSVFSNPKPVGLITRLMQIAPEPNKDGLILDFFAGSGTCGHAVWELNAADGGHRRFLAVQLPEPLCEADNEQREAAIFCGRLGRPPTISEVAKERLRRAGVPFARERSLQGCDVGFRVFKLDSGNVRPWEASRETLTEALTAAIDHVKSDRTEDDLLYDIILKHGVDLCAVVDEKQIGGHKVRSIGGGAVFACFGSRIAAADVEQLADGIAKWRDELAPANPELSRVVFRDSAFETDVAKTNLALILKERGFDEKLIVSL
jgi:adenine-specific DNA-methyltransferase